MHELGIITGVVDSVSAAAKQAGATRVYKVSLSVGAMTEAIEDALHFAFDVITEDDPLLKGSELDVHIIQPKSRCTVCGHEYEHDRFQQACPECGGFGQLIAGRELRIDSIEVETPDDDGKPSSEG